MREVFAPGGGLSIVSHDVAVPSSFLANYSSVDNAKEVIDADIANELKQGFIAAVPFKPFKVNALGAVQKKSSGKYRRITDLSRPKGSALNESLGPPPKFRFATIDDAVMFVFKRGSKFVVASKFDIKAAFRHVPIKSKFWHLFGFQWKGIYYVDLRMCFGLSIAPYVFWRISNFISRTAQCHYDVEHNTPYIDDFLLLSSGDTLEEAFAAARRNHQRFHQCLIDLGWPVADDKVVEPCTDITFLGIRFDLLQRKLSLPTEKLDQILTELRSFQHRYSATKRELEQLVGRLNFAAKVVKGGRTFLRRMIDEINTVVDHNATIVLSDCFRLDVLWWLNFASQWNGTEMMIDPKPVASPRFVTDASNLAVCAVFDGEFIVRYNDDRTNSWHINELECLAVYLAAKRWASEWRNLHIVVESDNTTTVAAINRGSSKSRRIMSMLRKLFWLSAKFNFHLTARFIAGKTNTLADAGSRRDFNTMLDIDPTLSMVLCPELDDDV